MNIISLVLDMDDCFEIRKQYKSPKNTQIGKIKPVESPEDCQTECQQDDACEFFTWQQKGSRCNLKAAKGNVIDSAKWKVSGPKNCPGGKGFYKLFNVCNMCNTITYTQN